MSDHLLARRTAVWMFASLCLATLLFLGPAAGRTLAWQDEKAAEPPPAAAAEPAAAADGGGATADPAAEPGGAPAAPTSESLLTKSIGSLGTFSVRFSW